MTMLMSHRSNLVTRLKVFVIADLSGWFSMVQHHLRPSFLKQVVAVIVSRSLAAYGLSSFIKIVFSTLWSVRLIPLVASPFFFLLCVWPRTWFNKVEKRPHIVSVSVANAADLIACNLPVSRAARHRSSNARFGISVPWPLGGTVKTSLSRLGSLKWGGCPWYFVSYRILDTHE